MKKSGYKFKNKLKNKFKKNKFLFLFLIIIGVISLVLIVELGIFGKKAFLDDSKESLDEILNELNLDEIKTGTLPTLPPSLGTPSSFDIDSCFEDPHIFTTTNFGSTTVEHDGYHEKEEVCKELSKEYRNEIFAEENNLISKLYMEALGDIYNQESKEHTRHLNNGNLLCSGFPAPPPGKWLPFSSFEKRPTYSDKVCRKDGKLFIACNLDYFFRSGSSSVLYTNEWGGSYIQSNIEVKCKTGPDCNVHCDTEINSEVFLKLSHSYYYTTSNDDSLESSSTNDDSSGTLSISDGNLEF